MNSNLASSYKRFVYLFDEANYSIANNSELLHLKKSMISGFQADHSSLQGSECIVPLVDLRIHMNHFFFATNEERAAVDDLLTEAFRNNANLVTEHTVTARLEKIYKENDVDWGGHLAVAGSMIAVKPWTLSDRAWNHVVAWATQDSEHEKSDRRRSFVALFAQRCGRNHSL